MSPISHQLYESPSLLSRSEICCPREKYCKYSDCVCGKFQDIENQGFFTLVICFHGQSQARCLWHTQLQAAGFPPREALMSATPNPAAVPS